MTAFALVFCITLGIALTGCGSNTTIKDSDVAMTAEIDGMDTLNKNAVSGSESEEMSLDLATLAAAPPIPNQLQPVASGTNVLKNSAAAIDASNMSDGYVMVRYLGSGTARLKVLITGPSGITYNYNLTISGEFEVFPLPDGSGSYKVGVYQNVGGTSYSTLYSTTITVTLKDEFAPFLLSNQYVNYTLDTLVVKEAARLCEGETDLMSKLGKLYDWVVGNYTYDYNLAKTVQSGYLPDLDESYAKKSGICFDYASTLTAMLRSQNIPTKLVIGYAGTAYHAWINVYSEDDGWINAAIYFDGKVWKRLDPTFASTGGNSQSILKYIGDGANYSERFIY